MEQAEPPTFLPRDLAWRRPRVRYATLRYTAEGGLPGHSRQGELVNLGDRWELPGGRVYRVIDRVSRDPGISKDEAIVVETDGLLDLVELDSSRLGGLCAERVAVDAAPIDVDEFVARAQGGDTNALFLVATLHHFGDRLPADAARAEALYRQAADGGQVPAMTRLARLLGDKTGWTQARGLEARRWWGEAARLGHPEALGRVAAFTERGVGGRAADACRAAYLEERVGWYLPLGVDWERQLAERVARLRRAPPLVDAAALVARGRALLAVPGAPGVRRDVPRAIELLEHAASLGDAGARFELSAHLAKGRLVPRDVAQAWRYLVQAVAAGHAPALAVVGNGLADPGALPGAAEAMSAEGLIHWRTAPEVAWPWLEQASVRWHVDASAAFARLLADGLAGPRDAPRAWHFAHFAAEAGHVEAMHLAATLAASGEVPGIGGAEALHWLQKAMVKNHVQARYDWAWAHEHGLHGLRRSRGLAIHAYSIAAYAGLHAGYLRMGRLFLEAPPGPERNREARQAFGWALEHGLVEAQAEIDRIDREDAPPPVDEVGYAGGNLRDVFSAVEEHVGAQAWATLFEPRAQRLAGARPYFEQMRDRAPTWHAWPEARSGELGDLYCAARLNDLMLAGFQGDAPSTSGPHPLDLTREQYVDVWQRLGFEAKTPTRFHPFWCEIVVLETSPDIELAPDAIGGPRGDAAIALVEVLWPAIHLGGMLFSRAGVRIRAPAAVLAPDVATVSTLHWTWRRHARPTTDLSEGWGHNSQWGTDFRRDFDLGDRYAYNVDVAPKDRADLRSPTLDARANERMNGLGMADRVDFLRHRCLTRHVLGDDLDLWPYYDFFEEPHTGC